MVDYETLGKVINALDSDHVFLIEDGAVIDDDGTEYAPCVYHDSATDITIDGDGWRCFTGLTGQYGYHGAVMHSSEFIGSEIAELLAEEPLGTLFAVVVVNVLPGDREDHEDHRDGECEPAGWAIAYKTPSAG
jgi:hypothetical protein